ncbi:uncharacterized protein EAF01_009971 [Botrytis porri]|uniref:uncharacterized protein n=1 Tax=Botrytis porri TaxID=87229 RepID=UPI001902390D|nr:uncharacterized protein EAF01_009971 [Botrytis porri]KAF7894520.1 hypothetical protein EAF01_009971 [Botrytis porri]
MRLRTSNISPGTQDTTLGHKDIPVSTVTKTFHDALVVTLKFGFHYFWIDSFCIIQDDVDDWKKKSFRRASVYGGSSLNKAATGAHDDNHGLFFDRNPNLIRRAELMTGNFEERGRPETSESQEDRSKVFVCTNLNAYKRSCLDSTLFQAWTLQERLLSPRTLHFGRHQIILERYTCTCFDAFAEVEDKRFSTQKQLKDLHYGLLCDKLVALSGIVKYFASKYNAEYLSGIWKEHLPSTLLCHAKVCLLKITNAAPETIWNGAEAGLLITPVAGRKDSFTRIGACFPNSDSCLAGNMKILEDAQKSLDLVRDDELSFYEGIYEINEAGKQMYIIILI